MYLRLLRTCLAVAGMTILLAGCHRNDPNQVVTANEGPKNASTVGIRTMAPSGGGQAGQPVRPGAAPSGQTQSVAPSAQ